MDKELQKIKEVLSQDYSEEMVASLTEYIGSHPDSEEAHFLLGNAYRKNEQWGDALNAYQRAIEINPDSPAQLAYKSIIEVLDFYNKDMFNQ